jgi:flavin-dependent dehydrogenase
MAVARYDIVVAGAGAAAAVAAFAAARLGRHVAIVGEGAPHQAGEGLADSAAAVLRGLGLGDLLTEVHHVRCHGVTCVTAKRRAVHPWPGLILDRARFNADLVAAAVAAGCEHRLGEVSEVTASQAGNGFTIGIKTGNARKTISAAMIIDATGRKAAVARRIGATRRVTTNLVAAWATLPAIEVAAEPGTLAIEALDSHWCYLAVGRRAASAAILGRRPPRDAASWLQAARRTSLLSGVTSVTSVRPVMQPANVSMLEPVCGDGWLACGDAAATFDPLSGYGLAFAIGTGYAAARSADAQLRGDRLAPLAFSALVSDRIARAWTGLEGAYATLALAPMGAALMGAA